jgi:hypothetical protein
MMGMIWWFPLVSPVRVCPLVWCLVFCSSERVYPLFLERVRVAFEVLGLGAYLAVPQKLILVFLCWCAEDGSW